MNYLRIANLNECREGLSKALADDEPWLIDLNIDEGANVFPMVPAGCGLDDIVGEFENAA